MNKMKTVSIVFVIELCLCCSVMVWATYPPPCPPCYSGTHPNCTWNCGSGQACCNGSCCGSGGCCDGIACYNPNERQCCGYGNGTTCSKVTTQVSYDIGLSAVADGIQNGIDSIPGVTASGWNASASFSATKGEECCNGSCTDYYEVSGSASLSGTVGVSVPGLGWHWQDEWDGIGGIEASLGINITPEISVNSASVAASGKVGDCGSCYTLSGTGQGTGKITVTAGGVVTLYTKTDWEWFNYELDVNVSASAVASVSAGASGAYKSGVACDFTGFCLTRYWASDVEVTGTITFKMLGISYSVTSDPLAIVDGCDVTLQCNT